MGVMSDDESGSERGDGDELDTRFQMTIERSTAEFLREAYPDQMNVQERLRAAVSEVRFRRMEDELDLRDIDD